MEEQREREERIVCTMRVRDPLRRDALFYKPAHRREFGMFAVRVGQILIKRNILQMSSLHPSRPPLQLTLRCTFDRDSERSSLPFVK